MTSSPAAVITAATITKTYGRGANQFTALNGVSLTITKGESVAIIGKSGSGKSTLMHVLALMDAPSGGSLHIDGHDVRALSAAQLDRLRNRTFGFVFQQFFLNAQSSVLDNVILPLKIAGVNRRERTERGLAALQAVELEDKARNKANDLSGGQKQRVVIARALINQPQIIFADEPTGNLDSATGAVIERMLFDLQAQHGTTLIVVTHDHDLAARCARQIMLKDGQIIAGGAV